MGLPHAALLLPFRGNRTLTRVEAKAVKPRVELPHEDFGGAFVGARFIVALVG